MNLFSCSTRLAAFVICLHAAIAAADAATVAVGAGASVYFDYGLGPVNGLQSARIGFFRNYSDADQGVLLRQALAQGTPAVQNFLAANFIPLGEPAAPVFSIYGVFSGLLGTSSTVAFQEVPAGSGHFSVSGSITGITFTDT